MLSQSQINACKINSELLHELENPLFVQKRQLWTKNSSNLPSIFFKTLKRYEFTKVGKTFGFETTRFLALGYKTLYYFEQQESVQPLGSCEIQNVYYDWAKIEENRFALVLNNGFQSTVYLFIGQDFIRDNNKKLAKFTVQLGFFEKYNIIQQLGEGSYASVYRATDRKTNQQFSAKVFSKDTSLHSILRQIQILRQIVGIPNVCQYYGLFQTAQEIVIVTQFIPGKDLKTVLHYTNGLQQDEIKSIILGICYGLRQCHKQNIIHRDIKPQNIIIDLDTMKPTIIDFGLSFDSKKYTSLIRCGTNAYMAPEVHSFPETNRPYSDKCDIFSLGIVAHLLMLGSNPLKANKEQQSTCKKYALNWNQSQAKNNWGEEGHQFLQKTLSICTNSRWDINAVLICSFLNQPTLSILKKVQSCSTLQDKHFDYDI